jgi:hypothetical protein
MPIDLHGKSYYTVAERLKLAYGEAFAAPTKVQRIDTELLGVGNVACVRATITFEDGRVFSGMSMLNLQATSPAERNAPLETCETSAVGRALAFAGYHGSPEGIAGYEEILLAQEREKARASAAVQTTVNYPDGSSGVTRMGGSGAAPRPVGGSSGGGGPDRQPGGPSAAQVRFANKLWADAGNAMPPPDWESMSSVDVSRKIDELKAGVRR